MSDNQKIAAAVIFPCIAAIVIGSILIYRYKLFIRLQKHNSWYWMFLHVVFWMSFLIHVGIYSNANAKYQSDHGYECFISDYIETTGFEYKIQPVVTLTYPDAEFTGCAPEKCKQTIHDFDREKYDACVARELERRPVGALESCWYNDDSYDADDNSVKIFWNKRRVPYYTLISWLLAGIAIFCFVMTWLVVLSPYFAQCFYGADYALERAPLLNGL